MDNLFTYFSESPLGRYIKTIGFFFKRYLFLVMLYPIAVGYTAKEGTEQTWIDFVLGIGSLLDITYDCYGHVVNVDHHRYADATVGMRYINDHFVASANAGLFMSTLPFFIKKMPETSGAYLPAQKTTSSPYLGARFGYDCHYFGIEAGAIGFFYKIDENTYIYPSGSIRFGSKKGIAVNINMFSGNSLMATGALGDVGLSISLKDDGISSLYIANGFDITGSNLLVTKLALGNAAKSKLYSVSLVIGEQAGYPTGSVSVGYSAKLW